MTCDVPYVQNENNNSEAGLLWFASVERVAALIDLCSFYKMLMKFMG